jgi:uncharacterized damage-inducible protein DinB
VTYDSSITVEEILARLAEQPKAIAAATAGLSRARLHRRPHAGEWSLNDVLAHLRSCSDMWGKYMAAIVAEDYPTIRAMNPRTWVKQTDYPEVAFDVSFRAYRRQRAELVRFLSALPERAWWRKALVTGAGRPRERTVHEYAEWLVNHERSHLDNIAKLAR